MSSNNTASNAASGLGDTIRSGAKGIFGAGEAIRGTAMQALDATFSPEGEAQNKAIADKGLADMKQTETDFSGANAGDKTHAQATTNASGAPIATGTQAGVHSTAPGGVGAPGSTGAAHGVAPVSTSNTGGSGAAHGLPQESLGGTDRL